MAGYIAYCGYHRKIGDCKDTIDEALEELRKHLEEPGPHYDTKVIDCD